MEARQFAKKLIEWYRQHQRPLPWRETKDPYHIWLSEIILQQTRVQQGLPYYEKFIGEFPTVHDLARAPEQKVLRLWQGLGYYTRARNLHACARKVAHEFGGSFPLVYADLLTLPGIGDYTAAAIASIAGNEPVAVVDGNVFRVLSRVFGIDTPINSTEGKKAFTKLANQLIPESNPDDFNQGMMEFGALHCTPRNPSCSTCIFNKECIARSRGLQADLPVKLKATRNRTRYFSYYIIKQGNSLMMQARTGKDIWSGLYEFYLLEQMRVRKPENLLQEDDWLRSLLRLGEVSRVTKPYRHVLSHQTIISRAVVIELKKKPASYPETLQFYSMKKVHDLPKPVLISRFLYDLHLLS